MDRRMPAPVRHALAAQQYRDTPLRPATCAGRSERENSSRESTVRLYNERNPGKEIRGKPGSKRWCYIMKNYLLLCELYHKTRNRGEEETKAGRKFSASVC